MKRYPARNVMACVAMLFAALIMGGCTPLGLVAGTGATVGMAAAQERGAGGTARDTATKLAINDRWLQHDIEMYQGLGVTVNEGRALLTGTVRDPDQRVDAVRLAWQVEGVEEVINEIEVADSGGVSGFAQDRWITTRLRTQIAMDREISSLNYSIDTVGGVVYLMGIAQNQQELDRVIHHARNLPRVRRVVSYVRLKSDPPPGPSAEFRSEPSGWTASL